MGKPGPGITYHKIIDRPDLKSVDRHFLETAITLLLWSVWLYWIIPLVIILLWLFGIESPAQRLFTRGTFAQLHAILEASGLAFLFILALEFLWIGYNHLVHSHKKGRRKQVPRVTFRYRYDSCRIAKEVVARAQKLRRVNVSFVRDTLVVTNLNERKDLRVYAPVIKSGGFPAGQGQVAAREVEADGPPSMTEGEGSPGSA